MPEASPTSNNTTTVQGRPESIPGLFRAVAAQYPERIVYEDRDRSVTYTAFDRQTNGVANGLMRYPDDRPVVLVAPVSIDSLTLIYGALKAGRLVAPLDPRWPVEQWLEVVHRLDGRLVVPDTETRDALPPSVKATTSVASELRSDDTTPPDVEIDPERPAMVFFTSGSTGAPKGTLVGHAMPLRTLDMFSDVGPHDRVALLAPLSFITGAVTAVGVALTGGSGHVFDASTQDLTTLPDWLDEQQITLLGLTVSLIALLAGAVNAGNRTIDSLRFVGLGGEHGSADDFAQALQAFPNAELRHIYGMTETGGIAHHQVGSVEQLDDGPMPVGRPWPWVRVAIVDDDGREVPDGGEGEIWATGRHVAFGYWDEPALTAERFVYHADGTRTVRTGDRGRFRPDGMLEVLGRNDRRVKVNGQLVDLSVVEHEVELLPAVREAVVSSVPTDDGGHRVVAHVVLDEPMTVGTLRQGLATRLPQYAMPRAFFRVDDVPRTINGKADRVLLRESAVGALPLETDYVAPRGDEERAVAELFSEILEIERVGVNDDFFELGGDSLSVVELQAGIGEVLGVELTQSEVLEDATVAGLARRALVPRSRSSPLLVKVNRGAHLTLFCVPGAANTPLQLRPLARRLPNVDVRAFAFRGLDRRQLPDRTVAAIARRNVDEMRRAWPDGPYRLFGYSFGGIVALEMAHQITASGDVVDLLVLLEPAVPVDHTSFLERGVARVRRVAPHPGNETLRIDRWRESVQAFTREAVKYSKSRARLATAGLIPRQGAAQHDVFYTLQTRILREHRPQPYRGITVLMGSAEYLELVAPAVDRLLPTIEAGGRRRNVGFGFGHGDLMREPAVAEVARMLEPLLDPRQT